MSETTELVEDFRELLTTLRPTPENAKRVFRALVRFGAPVAAHGVTQGLFSKSGYGYRMGVKPHLIEVLTKVDGIEISVGLATEAV